MCVELSDGSKFFVAKVEQKYESSWMIEDFKFEEVVHAIHLAERSIASKKNYTQNYDMWIQTHIENGLVSI
jgi:hypothetical protein